MENMETSAMIDLAVAGDSRALEALIGRVQDFVFNLSLRMLGDVADAEDAAQEILIRMMTNLSAFRKESSFTTWVYRIAVNYLIDCKKHKFAARPLTFAFYGQDIAAGGMDATDEMLEGMAREALSQELKMSCTNVMLQCFDPEDRCIFILGTMFRVDSRIAGELLDITPENYRQRLSRARRKMAGFLSEYCGLTETGMCDCGKRVGHAIRQGRLRPGQPEYARLNPCNADALLHVKQEMEALDDLSLAFADLPAYASPVAARQFIAGLLQSPHMKAVRETEGGQSHEKRA